MNVNFLFKYELQKALKENLIPNQPFEEQKNLSLDTLSAADWIRQMPMNLSKRTDSDSRRLFKRFIDDKRIDRKNPMADVIDLMDMYCKSRAEGFGAEVKRRILMGTYVLSAGYYDAYYKKAQRIRTLISCCRHGCRSFC